jgi:hypothetical protein
METIRTPRLSRHDLDDISVSSTFCPRAYKDKTQHWSARMLPPLYVTKWF